MSSNLDLNTSEGEFRFANSDFPPFRARLAAGAPSRAPVSNWPAFLESKAKEGYSAGTFEREGSTWVFICHASKGHCIYRMWPSSAG